MCVADLIYIYHVWTACTIILLFYTIFCLITILVFINEVPAEDAKEEFEHFKMKYMLYSLIFVAFCWIFLPGPTDMINLLANHFVYPDNPEQAKIIVQEIVRNR